MGLDFHIAGSVPGDDIKFVSMGLGDHEALRLKAIEKSCQIFQRLADYWADSVIVFAELEAFKAECLSLKGINESTDSCLSSLIELSQMAIQMETSLRVVAD